MPELPVDTYKEAAEHLRRPFAPEAVRFRPVGGGNIVTYVDARVVIERLNAVIPHKWSTTFEPHPGSQLLVCHLTIDGITRSDVGEPSQMASVKGAYSDALKRAAVQFGVGVSLYALRQIRLSQLPKGGWQKIERENKKDMIVLTDLGIAWLRQGYRKWAEGPGKDHFGSYLSHGDEENAGSILDSPEDAPAETVPEAPSAEVEALQDQITDAYNGLTDTQRKKRPALSQAKLEAQIRGATAEGEDALKGLLNEVRGRGDA